MAEPLLIDTVLSAETIVQLRRMGDSIAWCSMGGGFGANDPVCEPWAIAGGAGILGSRVLYTKQLGRSGSSRACAFACLT